MSEIFELGGRSDLDRNLIELIERKRHEEKFVGSQKRVAGHTMFSLNTITKEVKVAEVIRCKVYDWEKQGAAYSDKLHVEKNCVYLQALNKKNAIKHWRKMGYDL